MNIRIDYLYRDASNFKRFSEAVFSNPEDLTADDALRDLQAAATSWELFADMIHFRPELVGLETCFFADAGFEENEDDFELHELHEVSLTSDAPTDARSIEQFIRDLRRAGSNLSGACDATPEGLPSR